VVGALSASGFLKYTHQEFVGQGHLVTDADFPQEPLPIKAFRKSRRAQSADDAETWVSDGIANTPNTFDTGDSRTTHVVTAYNVRPEFGNGADLRVDETDIHPTLARQTHLPGYDRGVRVQEQATVRRLTPLECERLMGWPSVDGRGWTDIPWRGKDHAPDTKRYAACGNGVVAPVAEWIGMRLAAALSTGGDA
jgi:site-specific DNA-cytosine methylase